MPSCINTSDLVCQISCLIKLDFGRLCPVTGSNLPTPVCRSPLYKRVWTQFPTLMEEMSWLITKLSAIKIRKCPAVSIHWALLMYLAVREFLFY